MLGVLPCTCFSICCMASDYTITGRVALMGTNLHSKAGCIWVLYGEENVLVRLGGFHAGGVNVNTEQCRKP